MSEPGCDPALLLAWLSARSVCRGIAMPVPDRGGFRVDTDSPRERRRWVFPRLCDGVSGIARDVTQPRHFIKLCGPSEELGAALPPAWELQPLSHFMIAGAAPYPARSLPDGYRIESDRRGAITTVRVMAPDGSIAANGYGAEAMGVFIYDRIETAPGHRRKGLGKIVMNALRDTRSVPDAPELLVATEDGRALYTSLGWRLLSPYSTAVIPG